MASTEGRNHSAQPGMEMQIRRPRRSGTLVTCGLVKTPKRKVPVLTISIPVHKKLGDHGTLICLLPSLLSFPLWPREDLKRKRSGKWGRLWGNRRVKPRPLSALAGQQGWSGTGRNIQAGQVWGFSNYLRLGNLAIVQWLFVTLKVTTILSNILARAAWLRTRWCF